MGQTTLSYADDDEQVLARWIHLPVLRCVHCVEWDDAPENHVGVEAHPEHQERDEHRYSVHEVDL